MTAEDVLNFWFGDNPNLFRSDPWFRKNPDYDSTIREKFAFTAQAALDGALDPWAATPHGTLALVIALDQFPRNLHRGSHLAFAGDPHARRIARSAITGGIDVHLTPVQRVFLCIPYEHSENLADQDECVRLFGELQPYMPDIKLLKSAEAHRDVIRRFGRFPHRNAALGRTCTPQEETYLAEPGSGW